MKKKILTVVGIVAIATGVAFSLKIARNNDADLLRSLSNVEALARSEGEGEGEGWAGGCMCGNGSGVKAKVYQCVKKKCEEVDGNKGTLNTNYCSTCDD